MEDFDGDGKLDVMVTSSGPIDQMHLFHNDGDGTFRDVTRRSGLIGETGGLNLVLTDYNNDGRPDVLVLRGGWWGKQGCVSDVASAKQWQRHVRRCDRAGWTARRPTRRNTAAWADFDGDGWLDLFVGHESKEGDRHRPLLFHNNMTAHSQSSGWRAVCRIWVS